MGNIPYLLEVQICIAFFWLAYRLFIRRSGAFAHNRAYLLIAVAASFGLPALSIPVWTPEPVVLQTVTHTLPDTYYELPEGFEPVVLAEPFNWWNAALWAAAAGAVILLAGVARQTARMIRSIRRSKPVKIEGSRVVFSEDISTPHSFFNYIFINKSETNDGGLAQILAHEMAHIRLRHSYDALFAQVMLILFWWNPFVWLWTRSLREVHEFQADSAVLKQGFDSKQYITLLLETLAGIHPEFASGFSYSLIKNRLIMMTRKTGRMAKYRTLLALPVSASALLLFSFTDKPAELVFTDVEKSTLKPTREVITDGDITIIKSSDGPTLYLTNATVNYSEDGSLLDWTADGATNSPRLLAQNTASKAPLTFVDPEDPPTLTPGSNLTDAEIIVDEIPTFQSGTLKNFRDWVMGQLRYPKEAMEKNIQGKVTASFVIEKDGSLSNIKIVSSPDALLSQEVERALLTSPKWTPGKNKGVVVRVAHVIPIDFRLEGKPTDAVQSIDPEELKEFLVGDLVPGLEVLKTGNKPGESATIVLKGINGKGPAYIINDKESTEKEFNKLDTETIESITILKDASATDVYGEVGKNGVILVELKPLYMINDVKSTEKEFNKLDTETIESITVLKDASAAVYGDAGKNGVILVETKPTEKPQPDEKEYKTFLMTPRAAMYVIDGKIITRDGDKPVTIPENVKSSKFLKRDEAVKIYGEQAREGVLIIETK